MKTNKIQIIICCIFLSLIVLPSFSDELSLEIICGKYFPSDGFVNLIAENNSSEELLFRGFKRGGWAAFLAVSESGEILKTPDWWLNDGRRPSNGPFTKRLDAATKMFFCTVSNKHQSHIESYLRDHDEDLYITAIVHKIHEKNSLIEQSPFYKLQLKIDKLFCEKIIDEKIIPSGVLERAKKEIETIFMEEASPDYIWH